MPDYFIHERACADEPTSIGAGTEVWHFSHICAGAKIGKGCIFGHNTMVAPGVTVGDNVRVENNVTIYTGTTVEDDVFLGPSCVLTNVANPRSQIMRQKLFEETRIRKGATIGANATVVCGISIGRYAFIAAGAVVVDDISDYAFVVGVPGRPKGWMSRHGHRLEFRLPLDDEREEFSDRLEFGALDKIAICPDSEFRYLLSDGSVRCLDLDEEAPLSPGVGRRAE